MTDCVGGNPVQLNEFVDLASIMSNYGQFEAPTYGSHFTWSNKQVNSIIYSRIDRVVANVDCYLQ